MLLLDITIVNVALPDIQRDLKSSFSDLQWVVDAYSLGLAALLLTAGALADLFGRRTVFLVGVLVFTLASVLCGLSNTPLHLNLARALQGAGGAGMFATSLALLAQEFHGPERGTAFGAWGASIGVAIAVGPLVGGILTEAFGWQSIFFINVPIGAAVIWITLRKLQNVRDPDATGVDWAGLVTFSSGLFLLVFALVRGNAEGWGSALIMSFLIGSAVLLVTFVLVERHQARPMLDLTLFRKPAFAGASIVAFPLSASMFSMFLYLTLYIQNSLGYKPLEAGLRFLPQTLATFAIAPVAGRMLSRHVPPRMLMGWGMLLVSFGLLLMHGLDASSGWTALLAGFIVAGVGVGLTNPALAATAVGVVPPQRSGMGSGINNTFRQVGIATGVAGLGALFQHLLSTKIPNVPAEALASGNPAVVGAHTQAQRAAFLTQYTDALNTLFVVAGCIALAGAVFAYVLVPASDFIAPQGAPPGGGG